MAYGLRPAHPTRIRKYYVNVTYGTAIYVGSPVVKVGDSNDAEVRTITGIYAPNTLSEVEVPAVGDGVAITGIVTAIDAMPNALGTKYKPASVEAVISVADHPDAEFLIECDGPLTSDSIGLNAVLIGTGGAAGTGLSNVQLDTTSDAPAVDASNQLLIVGLAPFPENAIDGANPEVRVRINQHTEALSLDGSLGIA